MSLTFVQVDTLDLPSLLLCPDPIMDPDKPGLGLFDFLNIHKLDFPANQSGFDLLSTWEDTIFMAGRDFIVEENIANSGSKFVPYDTLYRFILSEGPSLASY